MVITVPVSIIFLLKGHSIAKKFIKPEKFAPTTLAPTSAVTYKDLNPATFFLSKIDQPQAEIKSDEILKNMMNFSVFKDALNIWKYDNGNKLNE